MVFLIYLFFLYFIRSAKRA